MASSAVRSAFRAALAAEFPTVPYIDTLSKAVDMEGLPAAWLAMDFQPSEISRAAIGSTPTMWRERGGATITAVGAAGAGDAAVVTQADAVVVAFRNWQSAGIGLLVTAVVMNSEVDQDSDGRWFMLSVGIAYERTYFG
jgi:stage V sporulation protein SpoVS